MRFFFQYEYKYKINMKMTVYSMFHILNVLHICTFFTFSHVYMSGIDSRFKTKSAYMKFNCESRIRGYLKEVWQTALSSFLKYWRYLFYLVEFIISFMRGGLLFTVCTRLMDIHKLLQMPRQKVNIKRWWRSWQRSWRLHGIMAPILTDRRGTSTGSALKRAGSPARCHF